MRPQSPCTCDEVLGQGFVVNLWRDQSFNHASKIKKRLLELEHEYDQYEDELKSIYYDTGSHKPLKLAKDLRVRLNTSNMQVEV